MVGRIRVVLVRPRRGGNVGSVARAMKNMGLSDLVLVAPRTPVGASARHMAPHAQDVLAARQTVPDLATALADTSLAIATVGRDTTARLEVRTPHEMAPEILEAAQAGGVSLVFGPEDHGLSNTEIAQCQRLLSIPTDAHASLNLAQAVLVCAYELHLARVAAEPGGSSRQDRVTRRDHKRDVDGRPASGAEREALLAHLEAAFAKIGFLSTQNPAHIMRDVRALFSRSGLTLRDVRVWRGLARQMGWVAGKVTGQPKRRKD